MNNNSIIIDILIENNAIKDLHDIENKAIEAQDSQLSLYLMKKWSESQKSIHKKIILNSLNAEANYYLRTTTNNPQEIERIKNNIILSEDPFYNYEYAKNFDPSNLSLYEKAVINNGDVKINYWFGLLKGSNKKKHADVIEKSNDSYYNYLVARNYSLDDNSPDEKVVLDNKNPEICYNYAKEVKGANVEEHGKEVAKKGDAKLNLEFAKNVPGADLSIHQQAVIDKKIAKYIYQFAKIPGANIKELENALIETGELYWIFIFAKDIEEADINTISDFIIASKNVEYNLKFIWNIPGVDIESHGKIVKEYGNDNDINKYLLFLNKEIIISQIIETNTGIEEGQKKYNKKM